MSCKFRNSRSDEIFLLSSTASEQQHTPTDRLILHCPCKESKAPGMQTYRTCTAVSLPTLRVKYMP